MRPPAGTQAAGGGRQRCIPVWEQRDWPKNRVALSVPKSRVALSVPKSSGMLPVLSMALSGEAAGLALACPADFSSSAARAFPALRSPPPSVCLSARPQLPNGTHCKALLRGG